MMHFLDPYQGHHSWWQEPIDVHCESTATPEDHKFPKSDILQNSM